MGDDNPKVSNEPADARIPEIQLRARVPLTILREHLGDAVMILQLGAAVNAVSAIVDVISSYKRPDDLPKGAGGMRNILQLYLTAAGLLAETGRLLQDYGDRPWALARAATKAGYYVINEPGFQKILTDTSPGSIRNTLLKWRHTMAFHWDSQPFQDYLNQIEGDSVELWHWMMPPVSNLRNYSRPAIQILLVGIFGYPLPEDLDRKPFDEIYRAQTQIQALYEAVLFGFLMEQGIKPLDILEES